MAMFYEVTKLSRKQTKNDRSLLRLTAKHHADLSIEVEHDVNKDYPRGGFSIKVKRGYLPQSLVPQLAAKYTTPVQFRGDRVRMLYTAARCAYFSRMLGRTGVVAVYGGQCLQLTDWYQGSTLEQNQMPALSFETRLGYMADIVSQLAMLHQYHLIHGDIKPRNVMITATGAHLIDLDGVRFIDESDLSTMHTLCYLDSANREKKQRHIFSGDLLNTGSDVYALGLTLATLFPEFFDVISFHGVVQGVNKILSHTLLLNDDIDYAKLAPEYKKLIHLIFSMVNEDSLLRPHSACEVLDKLRSMTKIQVPDSVDHVKAGIQAIKKDLFILKVMSFQAASIDGSINLDLFLSKYKVETIDEIITLFNVFPIERCDALLLPALQAHLTPENFIATMLLIPAQKRISLMFIFPSLVKEISLEKFENILKPDEIAFIKVCSRMIGLLESYTKYRVKMHDERVKFMLTKLHDARCIDDIYHVINANCSSPILPPNAKSRYARREPTHTFFSFGYNQLVKKCFNMIEVYRRDHVRLDDNVPSLSR